MGGEVGRALVGKVAPRGERRVVVRERLVRPRGGDVAADGVVERGDHAAEVVRVEQGVAAGRDGLDRGRRHGLRRARARHDERVGHDQPAEVECVTEVA
jgi:hypothetical protein